MAFIEGTGGVGPLGIKNQSGLTAGPDLGANGRAVTFDDLLDVLAAARAQNAAFRRAGWLFNGRLLASLSKLKDAQGRYLADTGRLEFDPAGNGGTLLGHPFKVSNQIPVNIVRGTSTDATYLIFSSDWDQCWIGENEQLELDVSGEATYSADGGTTFTSAYQNRQHVFRATAAHDIGLVRPAWFVLLQGIRP